MKFKPIEFHDTDLARELHPPLVHLNELDEWEISIPEEALPRFGQVRLEWEQAFLEECHQICDESGGQGAFKHRCMLWPFGLSAEWLERQLELNHVSQDDLLVVGTCDSFYRSFVTTACTLLEYFADVYCSTDDIYIVPVSRKWLILDYHHGETWFVRTD